MKSFPILAIALVLLAASCSQPTALRKNPSANTSSGPLSASSMTSPSNSREVSPPSGKDKVRIGAFNIQIFGLTKLSHPNTLTVLAKIASTYDVMAIEEVGSNGSTATEDTCTTVMNTYVARINQIVGSDSYSYIRGNQYAIVYRKAEFEVASSGLYKGSKAFTYTPLSAYIKSKTSSFDFAMLVIHTSPSVAGTEIPALTTAMSEVAALYSEPDVMCVGDFNGDGSYYSEGSGDDLVGFPSPSYITAISNSADTTVSSNVYAYDRMELSASMTSDFDASWGVVHPAELYDVTGCEGTTTTAGTESALSDHYPVWAEFSMRNDTD